MTAEQNWNDGQTARRQQDFQSQLAERVWRRTPDKDAAFSLTGAGLTGNSHCFSGFVGCAIRTVERSLIRKECGSQTQHKCGRLWQVCFSPQGLPFSVDQGLLPAASDDFHVLRDVSKDE